MSESKHTPMPWIKIDCGPCDGFEIRGPGGQVVANDTADFSEEDADFILRACNSHDALVAALEKMIGWAENPPEPAPRGHSCGPDFGNCDSECMARGYFRRDLAAARAALSAAKEPQ